MAALIRRSRDLGFINDNQYTYLCIQVQRQGYRLREPTELDIKREQPSLLRDIIRAHVGELGYMTTGIAEMVITRVEEFRSLYGLDEAPSDPKIIRRAWAVPLDNSCARIALGIRPPRSKRFPA
jgi:hypothetical protein